MKTAVFISFLIILICMDLTHAQIGRNLMEDHRSMMKFTPECIEEYDPCQMWAGIGYCRGCCTGHSMMHGGIGCGMMHERTGCGMAYGISPSMTGYGMWWDNAEHYKKFMEETKDIRKSST